MPEALARADYDFTVSEDLPPRRRARPRNTQRIEPSVSRVPQMREGASSERSLIGSYMRAAIRRPLRTLAVLACGAVLVSFFSNLLFMQEGPHPAPLFARQQPKLVEAAGGQGAGGAGGETAPPVIASVPLREPPVPTPPAAPRSAPPSIVSVPPARPPEPAKPAARQPDFDPIAQFLRSGVPATTASVGAPGAAEAKRVSAVQRALVKLGHKIDADGLMGPGTRAAIQKFERDNKLPLTGELNPRTLKALSARASIPIP